MNLVLEICIEFHVIVFCLFGGVLFKCTNYETVVSHVTTHTRALWDGSFHNVTYTGTSSFILFIIRYRASGTLHVNSAVSVSMVTYYILQEMSLETLHN